MKKILTIIIILFSFIQVSYSKEFFLQCERGALVKENNFKPIKFNFFEEADLLYVYDLLKNNGEYQTNKKRKFVVSRKREGYLDWIKISKLNEDYLIFYHSYFIDKNYHAVYYSYLEPEHMAFIRDYRNSLDKGIISPLQFFDNKQTIFTKYYWNFVNENNQITAMDNCNGSIYDFLDK